MKRLLVLIVFMSAFAGVALDEPYFIRMLDFAKLRAEPNPQSPLLDMAYPSLELMVVDELDDWLQVEKRGKRLFMNSEASFNRLEGGPRISTPYADLLCSEAPEQHPDGSWSFPRNCKVTVRSPINEFPSEAFDTFGHAPLIEGPEKIVNQVYASLFLLLDKAPRWYAFISNAAEKIIGYEQGSRYDTVSADAYVHPHLRTIFVSEFVVFNEFANNALRLAVVLVHEACHIHQVESGMALAGDEFEIMCHALEYDVIDDLGASHSSINMAESVLKVYLFFDEF